MRGSPVVLLLVLGIAACDSRRAAAPPPAPVPSTSAAPGRPRPVVPPPRARPRTATRPTLPPQLPATAAAWSRAEIDETAAAWDAAATAYERELAGCTQGCLEAAYAVVLARKNAMLVEPVDPPSGDEPAPLPPRVRAVIEALDGYVSLADANDPDLPGMKFLAASATTRWRQPDAVARLEALLREHRGDPTAEYAANLLLDLLLRAERVAEARAWVDELLADAAFLVGKAQLRQTLESVRVMLASAAPA